MHSLVFVDQIEGLPKVDDEDETRPGPASQRQYSPGTIRHRTRCWYAWYAGPAAAERLRSSQGMAMTR